MKKILLILILFLSCFLIYQFTTKKTINYLSIGDSLAVGLNENQTIGKSYSDYLKEYLEKSKKLQNYDKTFTDSNYRITDIVKIIKNGETKNINGKNISLPQLIKQADIITISLGMNELYYKLNDNTTNVYTYINSMLDDMKDLLKEISYLNNKKVLVLGYYNTTKDNQDIFNYINYKLEELVTSYHFEYVNLSIIFDNNPIFFNKNTTFIPNNAGYLKIYEIILEKIKNY